uniref:GDP-D-glucose phosphorylase 1 n=1 Tax=Ascaris lumbricoides TaxID=6252 RepID=A0A9J2QAU5_ASCLU
MRKIVMLGSTPRTQRSLSSIQLPVGLECTSSSPVFYYSTADFIYDLRAPRSNSDGNDSRQKLKELLMSRWEAAKQDKVFNYDLNCMYKLLPGDFNFSVQLNIERGQLRRKPMRFHAVREPFSILRWNFGKLNQNEVMMYLRCKDRPISSDPLDRHVVAVNSSPLERGHSLVIPAINRCLPQVFFNS